MSWRFLDEWGYACHTSLPHQLFKGVCAWTFLHSNRLSSCCRRGNYPHSTEPVPPREIEPENGCLTSTGNEKSGLGKFSGRRSPYRSINRGTKQTGGPLNYAAHLWSASDYPAGPGSLSRSLLPRRGVCPHQPLYHWTHSESQQNRTRDLRLASLGRREP